MMNHHPIRVDRFRSGYLSLRGEGHDCITRHHMEGWKKERRMKRWRFPAHSCTRTEWPLWVSPAHGCTQLCHIFRFPSLFLIFAAASAARLVKHVRFPEQQLSLALMDLACLHPLAFLITLSRDLLSPTIKLMNLAI